MNILKVIAELIMRALALYDKKTVQAKSDKIDNDPASTFLDDFGVQSGDKETDSNTNPRERDS